MRIGINASPAFKKNRTGVEEYAFLIIKNLAMLPEAGKHQFFLYAKESDCVLEKFPDNFKIKRLNSPILWAQGRLSFENLICGLDVFFSPVHVLPAIHPKKSVVTIHGLEFERVPEMYPFLHRQYLRMATRYAVLNAKKIIAVSENTKKDIVELYQVSPEKITVIHHGVGGPKNISSEEKKYDFPYILFLGTKEKKKNIFGLIKSFEIIKEKYGVLHKLVLVGGRPNQKFYKEEKVKEIINKSRFKEDIINLDFVPEEEKQRLLSGAEIFVYPSFYEGFGMPVLEAQLSGVPVITSNISALPEIAGKGALKINPKDTKEMAEAIYKVIFDKKVKEDLIRSGKENALGFVWEECAKKTLALLTLN